MAGPTGNGCRWHPDCFTCPFEECRLDDETIKEVLLTEVEVEVMVLPPIKRRARPGSKYQVGKVCPGCGVTLTEDLILRTVRDYERVVTECKICRNTRKRRGYRERIERVEGRQVRSQARSTSRNLMSTGYPSRSGGKGSMKQ